MAARRSPGSVVDRLRRYTAVRPEQTGYFHAMPGWWKTLTLLGAALTGVGLAQMQDAWFPGLVTGLSGVALTMYMLWLRRRAGGRGLLRF